MSAGPKRFQIKLGNLFAATFWAAVFIWDLIFARRFWWLPMALTVSLISTTILLGLSARMKRITAVVFCAVLVVYCGYGFYDARRQRPVATRLHPMNADPNWIVERARAVADLDAPSSFGPAYSINIIGGLVPLPVEFWALFRDFTDQDSALVLAYEPRAGPDLDAKLGELRTSIVVVGQHYPQITNLSLFNSESLVLSDGRIGTFQFQRGTVQPSGVEYWVVAGLFSGRNGPAMLVLTVPVSDFDQDRLRRILQSIDASPR